MRRLSIRTRLTLWYASLLAFTFTALAAALLLALQHSIYRTVDDDLRRRLQAFRYYIQQQQLEADKAHLAAEIAEDADAVSATSLVRISSLTGRWIYQSRATRTWPSSVPSQIDLPNSGRIADLTIHGEPFRVISGSLEIGVIQIGLPLSEFHDVQELLTWTVSLGSPLLLLLASFGGYWLAGRALRPVDELTERARQINAKNLQARLPALGTGDELDRLSATLNEMLGRLDSAFERIATFTADASHELRTPLAILRTTAEVTGARSRTPEEQQTAWNTIITQADRMTQLVDDLLLLARADAENSVPRGELVDVAAVLHETCQEMELMARSVGVDLDLQAPEPCTWLGDPEDLRRIFLILLDNAIKYTPAAGKVLVQLQIEASAEGRYAVILVRDTGIGISPDELPHIFDRFYRVSKDRSRKTGGSGLGLSIARYLAERRNGSIRVESRPGSGSTFYLVLAF